MTVAGWVVIGIMGAAIIAMLFIASWLEGYHPPDEDEDGFRVEKFDKDEK